MLNKKTDSEKKTMLIENQCKKTVYDINNDNGKLV